MKPEELKALLEQAYDAAWNESGDGWNGEIQGPADALDGSDKEYYAKGREEALARILALVSTQPNA